MVPWGPPLQWSLTSLPWSERGISFRRWHTVNFRHWIYDRWHLHKKRGWSKKLAAMWRSSCFPPSTSCSWATDTRPSVGALQALLIEQCQKRAILPTKHIMNSLNNGYISNIVVLLSTILSTLFSFRVQSSGIGKEIPVKDWDNRLLNNNQSESLWIVHNSYIFLPLSSNAI